MRKIVLALLTSITIGILAAWVYIQSHQPMLKGKLSLAGPGDTAQVYFDSYGIPHIYAGSMRDAYFTFGYVHAQDRLFQMEMMRRVGSGTLAEILGPDLVEVDAFFRTLGTHKQAEEDAAGFAKLAPRTREATLAYIDGINSYIAKGKTPLEYTLLGIPKQEYSVKDMYYISAYMAYSFALALRTDPIVEELLALRGMEYLRGLDLGYAVDTMAAYPAWSDTTRRQGELSLVQHLDKLPLPGLQGSNNWVLGPSRTLSDKVIFANDTHIKYASPSVWYEAHIEYPGFGFYGNFLAGVPAALIGHSRNHAWGLTMFEDDDSDFFYETFAAEDSSLTRYGAGTAPVQKSREVIRIKDQPDTSFTVYETVHGVLINHFLPKPVSQPVSMWWNYTAPKKYDLLQAFFMMNHASDIESFKAGVKRIESPGLNIAYGDAVGNIALWSAGRLVKRMGGEQGKTFIDGSKDSSAYTAFYPFESNPQHVNPAEGYLYSANQQQDSTDIGLYPGYYVPPTRYDRIGRLLQRMYPATLDSMKLLITDVKSMTEAAVAHEIARRIEASEAILSDSEEQALTLLAGWDGSHLRSDIEPVIYYKVLYYILQKAMQDEMGEQTFRDFLNTHLFKRSYPKLIFETNSVWWDNIRTEEVRENRAEIFSEALKKSILELQAELSENSSEWKWGRVHSTTHPHPLGQQELLAPWFNVGPFASPGGNETINNAGFLLNGDGLYQATYGPAMRILIDFADVEHAISILPTGNSGVVLSPHYKDQAEMYINGQFRLMLMNKKEIQKNCTLLEVFPSAEAEK